MVVKTDLCLTGGAYPDGFFFPTSSYEECVEHRDWCVVWYSTNQNGDDELLTGATIFGSHVAGGFGALLRNFMGI